VWLTNNNVFFLKHAALNVAQRGWIFIILCIKLGISDAQNNTVRSVLWASLLNFALGRNHCYKV